MVRVWCVFGCLCLACGDGSTQAPAADAGADADQPIPDAAPPPDSGPAPLAWVDFAATGCALESTEDGGSLCRGNAPLTVSFVALAPSPIETFRWRFGVEGQELPERSPSPTFTYEGAGSYAVSLEAAGPGGSAQIEKAGFVVVEAAPLGAPCTADSHCASGDCRCDGAEDGEFCVGVSGFCTSSCDGGCGDGACIDLAPTAPAEPAPWQSELCLARCDSAPCPDGLGCQAYAAAGGGYQLACFAEGLLAGIGSSCVDGTGTPADAVCASGLCAGLGVRGICTASCTAGSCPPGTACATFPGLGSLCVARCEATACDGDPWLACEAPGGTGDFGFTVDETASAAGYCAPRVCTIDPECSGGRCDDGICGPL